MQTLEQKMLYETSKTLVFENVSSPVNCIMFSTHTCV